MVTGMVLSRAIVFPAVPLVVLVVFVIGSVDAKRGGETGFDENYYVTWASDHVTFVKDGQETQLSMDASSGSGFGSKFRYGSGFFGMRIRLPGRDSAGVVTAFYVASEGDRHNELDFEFLGNREGKPITLQTNVFADGVGNREQRIKLWFDPTSRFHSYKLLWNQHQIVFYVDKVPIRVFKNRTASDGVAYPARPMQILASLWDGEDWATDGGQTKTNWSNAPFRARFRGFGVNGCRSGGSDDCRSLDYWWNREKYWDLDPEQRSAYENVRKNYMTYDYCDDRGRFPVQPPECTQWSRRRWRD